jgi:dienelactone hydrolase
MALPHPQGPFGVGCITHELIDTSRPVHLLAETTGRRLFLKLWYPAMADTRARPEMAWHSLRHSARTPAPVRALLSLMRQRTASRSGATMVSGMPVTSVVIYNHGMVSFAEENVSLMEALASDGHIVIAIEHHAQMAELRALSSRQSAADRRVSEALARELTRAAPAQRAALARDYYAASPNTGRIAQERAADTRWVMDQMEGLVRIIPGPPRSTADNLRVLLAGFSLGGAVSCEVALRDARVSAVVNIDGGAQGAGDLTTLTAPCLMLYSEANEGMNDALLPASASREVVPGTKHLNFHDVAGLIPVLRFTRALDAACPLHALRERNVRVCRFLGQNKE